ncbi:glycosyltransferase family 4 protein [Larkinella terrae]|uniref:Glycosyltransferase n=1 Tax=Larkinella terrae TaxID=2025311 RepID=A0A7K0EG98_9BACT|nr:glycosyltransferase family 4 protein [Larkinella terrae]MRS60732.1 glycosyltransferase [Larkinella terrae]
MRIAIIQGAFLPVPAIMGGAVEKMWFSLGKEFAQQGHEVMHLSRKAEGLPQSEIIDGVHHVRVTGFDAPKSGILLKFRDLIYTLNVRKVLPTDFDIIISNTFWAPVLLQKKNRDVCVVDVERMPKGQMRLYHKCAKIRTPSAFVAEAVRKELPGAVHNKIVTIPSPLPFNPRLKINSALKKPVILYVGRIHPEKGLDLLINAFKQTSQKYRLQLVGPWEISAGGGGKEYLDSLRQLAGDAAVDFVGPVFNIEVLNGFYIDAPIFIYPSIAENGETFGLAPLEAMAWGCVPIVSNLACFQDFIFQDENGLIFDHRAQNAVEQLAGQIRRVQEDDELREKLSRNGLNVRYTHSIQHVASLFLREFNRIVRKPIQSNGNQPAYS